MIEIWGIQFSLGEDTTTCMTSHYKDPVSSCLTIDVETTSEHSMSAPAATPSATAPRHRRCHRHLHHHHDNDNVIENLALVNAMDNLKDLFLLIDGSTYKKSLGQEFFAETFERVFEAPHFSATTGLFIRFRRGRLIKSNGTNENEVEMSYKKSFEEYLTLFNAGVRAEKYEFKALSKRGLGMLIEYTIQAILKNGQEYVFEATAIVNPKNGKLVLLEERHAGQAVTTTTTTPAPSQAAEAAASDLTTTLSPPPPPTNIVSGQVPACPLAARVASNFPTECQLSHQNVHPSLVLGNNSMGLRLCPGETDLLPTERAGTVIKICLVAAVTNASTLQVTSITSSPLPSSSSGTISNTTSPDAKSSNGNWRRLGLMPPRRPRQAIMNGRGHRIRIDIQQATTPSAAVPYAGGVWLEELKQPQRAGVLAGAAAGPVFMLRNKQDIPIAQCIPDHPTATRRGQNSQRPGLASSLCHPSSLLNKESRRRHHHRCRAYNIMGRNPMHEDDLPTASQFYPWYRVETNNTNTTAKTTTQSASSCTISIWNGNRYEPYVTTTLPLVMPSSTSCTASETEMDHDHNDDDDDDDNNHRHDHGLQPQQQHQEHYSHRFLFSSVLKDADSLEPSFSYGYLMCRAETNKSPVDDQHDAATTKTWDLTISPHVDPALMICVAAVTRELSCN